MNRDEFQLALAGCGNELTGPKLEPPARRLSGPDDSTMAPCQRLVQVSLFVSLELQLWLQLRRRQ